MILISFFLNPVILILCPLLLHLLNQTDLLKSQTGRDTPLARSRAGPASGDKACSGRAGAEQAERDSLFRPGAVARWPAQRGRMATVCRSARDQAILLMRMTSETPPGHVHSLVPRGGTSTDLGRRRAR